MSIVADSHATQVIFGQHEAKHQAVNKPVWNEGDVHGTCAVHKGFFKCTSCAQSLIFGSGAHKIFRYFVREK